MEWKSSSKGIHKYQGKQYSWRLFRRGRVDKLFQARVANNLQDNNGTVFTWYSFNKFPRSFDLPEGLIALTLCCPSEEVLDLIKVFKLSGRTSSSRERDGLLFNPHM